uniref:Uncharacterized protein n=1 Tax=Anguilla anguilla TaxID=7936 RepID=A0A0E9V5D4_ANGAN
MGHAPPRRNVAGWHTCHPNKYRMCTSENFCWKTLGKLPTVEKLSS